MMEVVLLSPDDGVWPLLDGCSAVVAGASMGRGTDDAAAARTRLRSWVRAAAGPVAAMEPDMLVVVGCAFSPGGFPPWMLQTTEMYHLGSLPAVTAKELGAVLQRHCATRQRFGA
jgi:hypothetical protein